MGAPGWALPWQSRFAGEHGRAAPQVVFGASALSQAKQQALRRMARKRALLIAGEVAVFVALLALLLVYSLRLKRRDDNRYAQWSSSWVLIMLSVLLVVVGLAVLVTFYFFRERRLWIEDAATADEAVLGRQGRGSEIRRWSFFRYCRPARERERPQEELQQPWLQPHSRNSRAWRKLQAHQRALNDSSRSSSDARPPPQPPLSPRHLGGTRRAAGT
ncbi:hypothetical protein LPJ61_000121 [Coemansia biformis]|uniref:Uncharacterized protein n=1 Tax=Coemansia biformis TaxID=1286918 RepID=A0A9W7YC87_9FUNG|nr:hypothetical protein LPJ61_000121 [Coemansia biformis]